MTKGYSRKEDRKLKRISQLNKTLKKKHKTVARLLLNRHQKKLTKRKKYTGSPLRPNSNSTT